MRKWMPFLSSLLLGAAFLDYRLGFLAVVGLIPLLIFIDKTKSRRQIILFTWLFSLVFYAVVMAWILVVDSSTWSSVKPGAITALKFVFWGLSSLIFSVSGLVFGWLASLAKKKNKKPRLVVYALYVASAWVLGEFIRSWLFSIFWTGSQANLGPHWNFGNLGLGLATTPLVHSARLLGFFGLTFLAVATNLAIYWLFKKKYKPAAAIILLVAVISGLGVGLYRTTNKDIEIGVVQLPKRPGYYHPALAKLISSQGSPVLDLLVLPEYASFLEVNKDKNLDSILNETFKGQPGAIVYSREDLTFSRKIRRFDNLVYADSSGQVQDIQGKHFLVPTGEFMPEVGELLLKTAGQDQAIGRFNFERGIEKAKDKEKVISVSGIRLGGLACSGVISAKAYRDIAAQGSDVLINPASLTVFEGSKSYFNQTKAMARFHAVAHNQPFVQATQGGFSYVIDKNGKFLVETKNKGIAYVSAGTRIGSQKTIYSKLGDFMVLVSLLIVACYLLNLKGLLPKKLLF